MPTLDHRTREIDRSKGTFRRGALAVLRVIGATIAVIGILLLMLVLGASMYLGMFECTGYFDCDYKGTGAGVAFVVAATLIGAIGGFAIIAIVTRGRVAGWQPLLGSTVAALMIAVIVLFASSPWPGEDPTPFITTTASPLNGIARTGTPSTATLPPLAPTLVPTSVAPATSAPEPTPPAPDGTPIGAIVARVQETLDEGITGPSDLPPGVLGAPSIDCQDRGRIVRLGDVFACRGVPHTDPDVSLESFGIVFLVLSDDGDVAGLSGTDMPQSTDRLVDMYARAGKGMFCRDLFGDDVAHPFAASGLNGRDGYFVSLAYWFLEGMPARMDADGNGIPCETLFDAADVEAVWSGLTD